MSDEKTTRFYRIYGTNRLIIANQINNCYTTKQPLARSHVINNNGGEPMK